MNKLLRILTITIPLFLVSAQGNDANEAAKELANPNTALASLTLKPQVTYFDNSNGADFEETSYTFQPVLPFPREDGSKIIIRPAITYVSDNGFGESGWKDISSDVFYAFASKPGTLEGIGGIFSIPTGSSDIGQGEVTSLGASYIYGSLSPERVMFFFPQHVASVDEGDLGDAGKVNLTTVQVGYVGLPGGGWNWGSTPKIKYNWEATSGNEWTVPLNFSIGKTVMLGGRPWKFSIEADYFVESPDPIGQDYQIIFNITPVVKNALADWFK